MSEKQKKRKINMELRKKIKEEESKQRAEAMRNAPVTIVEKKEEKVSFDIWWITSNKQLKLQPHLKEIIWADFKARGACSEETQERYDEMLALFGYKK